MKFVLQILSLRLSMSCSFSVVKLNSYELILKHSLWRQFVTKWPWFRNYSECSCLCCCPPEPYESIHKLVKDQVIGFFVATLVCILWNGFGHFFAFCCTGIGIGHINCYSFALLGPRLHELLIVMRSCNCYTRFQIWNFRSFLKVFSPLTAYDVTICFIARGLTPQLHMKVELQVKIGPLLLHVHISQWYQ